MTPPATAAARSSNRSASGSRRGAVRHPRRISGPAGPARSAAIASTVAIPAPGIALPLKRPSRPATAPRRRQPRESTSQAGTGAPGLALRAIDALSGISGSALLDKLIRGRLWIGLLAFALIGIVAMQLFVLELNTGIGRTLTRVATLQRENAQLGIEDSTYSAEGRVAPTAAASGMVLAPAGAVHFVAANPSDASRAAAALSAAAQTPSSAALSSPSGAGEAGSGEAGGAEAGGEASGAGAGGEASGAGVGGEASGAGAGGGSSEPSATAGTGASVTTPSPSQATSTSGPTSTPATSTTASTPTGAATQASGASGPSSSESAAASGPGGGTPASPRE